MLDTLLITCENGWIVKTYGLHRLKNYNMKFTFICIVIFLSCSVCASGDLEIYPGLRVDLSSEEQRRRLEDSDETPVYSESQRLPWPWHHLRINNNYADNKKQLFNLELPERLRNFEEFLVRNENDLKAEEDLPVYYNSRPSFEDAYDDYRNLDKSSTFDSFGFKDSNTQLLEDVRPYPHDDFSFGEEEEGEEETEPQNNGNVNGETEPKGGSSDVHAHHVVEDGNEEKGQEASGNRALDEAKMVDDPTEFAYPPSDPRFYQSVIDNGGQKIVTKVQQKLQDPKIRLSHRSDETVSEQRDHHPRKSSTPRFTDNIDVVEVRPQIPNGESTNIYIIAIVAGVSAAATIGLIAVGIGWYNLQKHVKNASDIEYPAYGVTGPNKDASPSGDRRLAQSAQMYHYQHQKQQIIAMESRAATGERHGSVSEADSEEENEEGDYTVYECPGLAPTGEMEVKNPLFQDDPTPAQTPPIKPNGDDKK